MAASELMVAVFLIALATLFSAVYACFGILLLVNWKAIHQFKSADSAFPFVSILICMRNESAALPRLLKCMAAQDYRGRNFEILVSDDYSEDDSVTLAKQFAAENPACRLRIIQPEASQKHGKKYALAAAVKNATGEILALTDADCRMNKNWLATMVNHHLAAKAELTAGPVRLTGTSFFQQMQKVEFMSLSAVSGSFIRMKKPFMINAANMIFNKQSFIECGRLSPGESSVSGDDTFFMLQLAKKNPEAISFCKDEDAMVETEALPALSMFIQQRIRWASKTRHYHETYIRAAGAGLFVYNFLILLLFIPAFIHSDCLVAFLILFAVKTMTDLILLLQFNRFYKINSNGAAWLATLLLHPVYITLIPLLTLRRGFEWKGRRSKT